MGFLKTGPKPAKSQQAPRGGVRYCHEWRMGRTFVAGLLPSARLASLWPYGLANPGLEVVVLGYQDQKVFFEGKSAFVDRRPFRERTPSWCHSGYILPELRPSKPRSKANLPRRSSQESFLHRRGLIPSASPLDDRNVTVQRELGKALDCSARLGPFDLEPVNL